MRILENKNNLVIIKDARTEQDCLRLYEHKTITLFSYNTKIATLHVMTELNGLESYQWLELTKSWDYSRTTLKHFKNFINNYTQFRYTTKKGFEDYIPEAVKHNSIKWEE